MDFQKNPQTIEPKQKKGDREQVSFGLNSEDEIGIKRRFQKITGARGTKSVLLEFMRRYADSNGGLLLVDPSIDNPVRSSTGPHAPDNPANKKLRTLFERVLPALSAKDRRTVTDILEMVELTQQLGGNAAKES